MGPDRGSLPIGGGTSVRPPQYPAGAPIATELCTSKFRNYTSHSGSSGSPWRYGTEPRIDAPAARWRKYGVAGPPDAACIRAAVVDVIRGKGASQLMNTTSVRDTAGFGTKRRRAADTGSAAVAPRSPMPDVRLRAQRRVRGWLLLLGLGLILLGMRPAAALDRYEGLAYAAADGGLAYSEIHWRYHDRGRPARLVTLPLVDRCDG